jgi:hypothetical protein
MYKEINAISQIKKQANEIKKYKNTVLFYLFNDILLTRLEATWYLFGEAPTVVMETLLPNKLFSLCVQKFH